MSVDELSKRANEVVKGTIGDSITPFATSLLASAAVVTGHAELSPWAIPAGALAGALGEQGYVLVSETLKDRASRVVTWLSQLTQETGQPAEDFIADHAKDGQQRDFLGHLVDAVASSRDVWKIEMLARAYAQGAQDPSIVDETLLQVELLKKLDAPHARYLAALRRTPKTPSGIISEGDVLNTDPGLRAAAPFIRRALVAFDLIDAKTGVRLTDLGRVCVDWLESLGNATAADEPASGG